MITCSPHLLKLPLVLVLGMTMAAGSARAQEGLPPMPLWPGNPPGFVENAPAETTDSNGNILSVSIPSLTVYLPAKEQRTGLALLVCPGGGYRALGWITHVVTTARYFNPRGIAVIGLKYRTRPPYVAGKEQVIPLMDVKRAMRIVRAHAPEWNIERIGVAGFSAGADVALTLAQEFDDGDSQSGDPIERVGCRPDFVVSCSTWHGRQKASPFTFSRNTPPVFLVHATDDANAPIELPYAIKSQLESLGVPVRMEVYPEGGHGVAHLIPKRIEQNSPATKWPERMLEWLDALGLRSGAQTKTAPKNK